MKMFRTTKAISIGALVLTIPAMSHADTFHVPDDYSTIQDAIDNVANNDTIIVRAGSYREGPIDFLDKSIQLISEDGPETTKIIMDQGIPSGSVIQITGNQSWVQIDGFSITGGSGVGGIGGGVRVQSATDVYIQNCWIYDNTADSAGGGVYGSNDSTVTIQDCIIKWNVAGIAGGGAYLDCNSQARASRTAFLGNLAGTYGGGLHFGTGSPGTKTAFYYADNCVFSGNVAVEHGGAVSVMPPLFVPTSFCGAINCTFSGNLAQINPVLSSATSLGADSAVVQNSIISNNVGAQLIMGLSEQVQSIPAVEFDNCLVDMTSPDGPLTAFGIFVGEAEFVDEFGSDGIAGTGDEDFGLTPLSAAIDQASENLGADIGIWDLLGNPRRVDDPLVQPNGTPAPRDLGATEFDIASIAGTIAIWNAPGQMDVDFMANDNWYNQDIPAMGIQALVRIPGTMSHALVQDTETIGDLAFDGGTMMITAPNGPEDGAKLRLRDSIDRGGLLRVSERLGESTYVFMRDVAVEATAVRVEDGHLTMRNTTLGFDDGTMIISPNGRVTFGVGTSIEYVGTIYPTIINNGVLELDGSTFDSNYDQASSGVGDDAIPPGSLVAEIAPGDTSSTSAKLNLVGNAVLGGTLAISAPDGAPQVGEFVPVVSASSIEQNFDVLYSDGLPDGVGLTLQINNNLTLGTSEASVEFVNASDTTFEDAVFGATVSDGIEDSMLADIDNDGDDDLILTLSPAPGESFGYVAFLENFGAFSGVWLGFDTINIGFNTVKISGSANGFSVGHVDSDSLLDIVVANKASGTVHVLQNTSTGTLISFLDVFNFDSSDDLPPGVAQPTDTWLGDLDNDGLDDLVVTNETDGSMVSFQNVTSFAIGFGPGTKSVPKRKVKLISPIGTGGGRDQKPAGIGDDKNSDGTEEEGESDDDDSAGGVQTSKESAGFFSLPRIDWNEHAVGEDPVDMAVGDLDDDGMRDIVTANRDGQSVSILIGTSSSEFDPALTLPIGENCESIGLGDFDADDDLDIAVLVVPDSGPTSIRVLRNDTNVSGMLSFTLESDSLFSGNDAFKIDTGNLNGDSHDDIVVHVSSTSLMGTGESEQGWGATLSGSDVILCMEDIDRNGTVDGVDLAIVLGSWGDVGTDLPGDINGDGTVDGVDLAFILGAWGDCNSEGLED